MCTGIFFFFNLFKEYPFPPPVWEDQVPLGTIGVLCRCFGSWFHNLPGKKQIHLFSTKGLLLWMDEVLHHFETMGNRSFGSVLCPNERGLGIESEDRVLVSITLCAAGLLRTHGHLDILHHFGCMKPCKYWPINHLPIGAGFLSIHSTFGKYSSWRFPAHMVPLAFL